MINSDGFQVVKRKKGSSKLKLVLKKNDDENKHVDVNKCRKQIAECLKILEESKFWKAFHDTFLHSCKCTSESCTDTSKQYDEIFAFRDVIVYGIGSIADSVIPRYQFALVLLLSRTFGFGIYLFDPVLNEDEKCLIEEYGVHLILRNEECKRRVSESTVFLMLHCGKAMYNNLLWANWDCLKNICIIGNTFSSYLERMPSRELERSATYIKNILPYTREHEIENNFLYDDIFNDTSVHTFPLSLLGTAHPSLWSNVREPERNTDDTEIITKNFERTQ